MVWAGLDLVCLGLLSWARLGWVETGLGLLLNWIALVWAIWSAMRPHAPRAPTERKLYLPQVTFA